MSKKIHKILLFILLGWISPTLSTVAHANAADSIDLRAYPYIRIFKTSEEATKVVVSDSDFLSSSGTIRFRVNRYDQYVDTTLFHDLAYHVLPYINKSKLKLVRMAFRGASSPEGPYDNNYKLSQKRAEALVLFLRAHLHVQSIDSVFTVETIAEDYSLLVTMMRKAHDPAAEEVEQLVNYHAPRQEFDILKKRLQRLQHGKLWRHMLRQYFPDLRAAHIILFFEPIVPKRKVQPLTAPVRPLICPEQPVPHFQLHADTLQLARRELLSVKTNALLDLAYMPGYNRWCPIPNIALEYYPLHGHFTFGASFDFPWWQHYWQHKYFELRNYQLETRYYFRSGDIRTNTPGQGQAFRGFYLQGYVHGGLYLFAFNRDKGWTGEFIGAGVGFGYVMPLARRWRLELGAQVGFIFSKYDPFKFEYRGNVNLNDHLYYYDWILPASQFKKRQYRYTWIGPTRIGITLSYDLLYRRRAKKGISFKSYEMIERRYER